MGMIRVGYHRHPAVVRELVEDIDDETSVDLDMARRGIHWLLTGTDG
jgi:hypothetical protein